MLSANCKPQRRLLESVINYTSETKSIVTSAEFSFTAVRVSIRTPHSARDVISASLTLSMSRDLTWNFAEARSKLQTSYVVLGVGLVIERSLVRLAAGRYQVNYGQLSLPSLRGR